MTAYRPAHLVLVLLAAGCATAAPRNRPGAEPGSTLTLVESAPIETTLDHPDVPNAHEVWKEMFDSAKRTIDIAQFYTSDERPPSRLTPLIQALVAAGERGVRVRFLVDDSFADKYPETLWKIGGNKNVELRRLKVQPRMGGVLHAKYFIVDRKEGYLGSQNFDWRSLEHIQEMGVRLRNKELAGSLLDVFETDWELAGGAPDDARIRRHPAVGPVRMDTGEVVTFVASPKGWLPKEEEWDLPYLLKMIDGAARDVSIQLLTYKLRGHDGHVFTALDEAIRRAVARGVNVRLLVSDWSVKPASDARRAIHGLDKVGGKLEVKVITIPPWSGGAIPFARVCHSKFMVVDGRTSWVGTSNWDGDYFYKSRNVGVVVQSQEFTSRLRQIFDDAWGSPYTKGFEATADDDKPAPPPWQKTKMEEGE